MIVMLKILYTYLIQRKSLFLPGIGHFRILQGDCRYDAADQLLYPSAPNVVMTEEQPPAQKDLFAYISRKQGTSELEAIQQFNTCLFEMRQQLKSGRSVEWEGVGVLTSGEASTETLLSPYSVAMDYYPAVAAHRVVRQNQQHPVLVGDTESDTLEMHERLFGATEKNKWPWWGWAIVLGIIGLIFWGYHLYSSGNLPPFANRQWLKP